jgi:hypothetical protein
MTIQCSDMKSSATNLKYIHDCSFVILHITWLTLLATLTSQPLLINSVTISKWPSYTVRWSGVFPNYCLQYICKLCIIHIQKTRNLTLFRAFMSQPLSINSVTICKCPLHAASWIGFQSFYDIKKIEWINLCEYMAFIVCNLRRS